MTSSKTSSKKSGTSKILLGSYFTIGISLLVIAIVLIVGQFNGKTDSGEVVFSNKDIELTEGEAFESVVDLLGESAVRKALLYKMLDENYKISESDIEKGLEKLEGMYADYGGLEGLKSYYNYTDETLNRNIKNELLLAEGFKDLRGYDEDELKASYEVMKNSKKVLEVVVYNGAVNGKTVIDALNDNKTSAELEKLAGDDFNKTVFIKESNFIKGQVDKIFDEVFETKVGDIVVIKNEEGQYASHIKVVEDVELTLDEVKTTIEFDLLYGDLKDPEAWLFAKLVETNKYKFSKVYKDLEGDNVEALEALEALSNEEVK